MLGLLRRTRTTGARPRNRVVLRLEGLEWRDNPDIDPGNGGVVLTSPPVNHAPQIVDFTCQQIDHGLFLITGRVIDENPAGLTVTLGGSTSAAGTAIITLTDGSFSKAVQLRTDGTDNGWITAVTVDLQGLVSNTVQQYVTPTP
jgi:hypothetical protein